MRTAPSHAFPQIAIIIPSRADYEAIRPAIDLLENIGETGIPVEVRVISAYRTPKVLEEYCESAVRRGIEVIIAGSGGTNELALTLSAKTVLPVIGLPLRQKQAEFQSFSNELAAIMSALETPAGYPVPTFGFNHAENAAFFAAQMLAIKDKRVHALLEEFRAQRRQQTLEADRELSEEVNQAQEARRAR